MYITFFLKRWKIALLIFFIFFLKLDVNHFIQMQEAFQPDMCQALYDGDTNKESSVKRSVKAVNRTLTFLDQIQDKWKESEVRDYMCF